MLFSDISEGEDIDLQIAGVELMGAYQTASPWIIIRPICCSGSSLTLKIQEDAALLSVKTKGSIGEKKYIEITRRIRKDH